MLFHLVLLYSLFTPPQVEVAIALAALEARCGNLSAARKTYLSAEAAAAEAPELLGRILIEWASLERRFAEPRRAQRLLGRAESLRPHSAKALLLSALLKWELGERRQARVLLETALLFPVPERGSDEWRRQIELFTTWAKLEAGQRSSHGLERALAIINRAETRFGDDGSLLQARGVLQLQRGESVAARHDFRSAAAHGSGAPVFVAWALLEESEGNVDEACLQSGFVYNYRPLTLAHPSTRLPPSSLAGLRALCARVRCRQRAWTAAQRVRQLRASP